MRLNRNAVQGVSAAVVKLEFKCGNESTGVGTGFYERHNNKLYLVTNWHNVMGRRPQNGCPISSDGITPDRVQVHGHNHPINPVAAYTPGPLLDEFPIEHGGGSLWKMHPRGQAVDVVVMPITGTPSASETTLGFDFGVSDFSNRDEIALTVGDSLVVIGFPLGLAPTETFPIWKGAMVAAEPRYPIGGEPRFLIDAATREGMSGSPVFKRQSDPPTRLVTGSDHCWPNPVFTVSFELAFVGIYSGRLGSSDLLEAQLGTVWYPEMIYETIEHGLPIDYVEC